MILFIGHDASLTGAPRSFLNIIKYVRTATHLPIEIILQRGGALLPKYESVAQTTIWQPPDFAQTHTLKRIRNNILKIFRAETKSLIEDYKKTNISLIVNNTCTNWDIIQHFEHLDCPIISRIPEMQKALLMFNVSNKVDKLFSRTTHFICPSKAAQNDIVTLYGIRREQTSVCYSGIDLSDYQTTQDATSQTFTVTSCGIAHYNKGFDLFIKIANNLAHHQDIKFVWIGSFASDYEQYGFEKEIKLLGLKNIEVTDTTTDVSFYYRNSDVFLMLSREDTFPIVNLEAGIFENPVICFQNSGGSEELIDEQSGFVLPFLDVESVSEKILFLKEHPLRRKQMGTNLSHKIKNNFTTEQTMPKIWSIIQDFL